MSKVIAAAIVSVASLPGLIAGISIAQATLELFSRI